MKNQDIIVSTIVSFYPEVQAIYLFGSYDTEYELLDSDVDIALLFSHETAKSLRYLSMSPCAIDLAEVLKKDVDLINLRLVSTVFQNEIIASGTAIYKKDENPVDEFEMLTLSFYQKLNEERKEIVEDIRKSGRVLAV